MTHNIDNPIHQRLLQHIDNDEQLEAVTITRPCRPSEIVFHFRNRAADILSFTCDRATFRG
jgi:hypothetical protein